MKKLALLAFAISLNADNFLDPNPPVKADVLVPSAQSEKKLDPIEPIFTEEPININESQKINNIMAIKSIEFWVQMGAFERLEGAKTQERKLRSQGLNAKIFSSDLHRVAVGPYKTRESAQHSMQTLKTIENEAFLTTPENLQR